MNIRTGCSTEGSKKKEIKPERRRWKDGESQKERKKERKNEWKEEGKEDSRKDRKKEMKKRKKVKKIKDEKKR